MNKRAEGEIGHILTSSPSLIFVFILMFIFMYVSGFLSKDLGDVSYESPVTDYERQTIETKFPPKNADSDTLIDVFLKSELKVGDEIVTVEQAIEQMCRVGSGPYSRANLAPSLVKNFESVSATGLFAIAGFSAGKDSNYLLYAFSPNLKVVNSGIGFEISQEYFKNNFDKPSLQQKTICASIRPTTVYVLPGGLDESQS